MKFFIFPIVSAAGLTLAISSTNAWAIGINAFCFGVVCSFSWGHYLEECSK